MKAEKEPKPFNPMVDTMPQSMVVGKIPAGEGLWGAIEKLKACDVIRNGTLVVFSHEQSGRIGVFCNRYLTGAVIDGNGENGLKSLKELLALQTGMFCFRPCWGDESSELGQKICIDIEDVLQVRKSKSDSISTVDAIQAVDVRVKIDPKYKPGPEHESDESSKDTGKAVTPNGDSAAADSQSTGSEQTADSAGQAGADGNSSQLGYLDWTGKNDDKSLNLRKILLPVMTQPQDVTDNKSQIERDLDTYKQILKEEEHKVRQAIETTLSRGPSDSSEKRSLDDMQLLAGMLQSQEEMITQRWQGLDEIPTPNAQGKHLDNSGQFKSGAPLRSSKEFLAGCADLIEQQNIKVPDPREFLRKADRDVRDLRLFWQNHPRAWIGFAIIGILVLIMGLGVFFDSCAVDACIREGKQALKQENWQVAIMAFSDALKRNPVHGRAHFYRAIAYEEMGDDKKAQADFKTAKTLGVSAGDIAIAQAGVCVKNEDWQKALDVCDEAIGKGLNTPAIWRLRASADLHLGAYKDALSDCNNALAVCGNDADLKRQILADRGYAKIQLQQFDSGASDFDKALNGHADEGLYLLMGDAYRKAKHYSDAISAYSQVLELNTRSYDAYVARGICQAALHHKEEALKDFGRALEINPSGVEALIQRGSLQLAAGAYRSAIDDLQTAYDLNPTIEEAHQKLTMALSHAKGVTPPKNLVIGDSTSRKLPSDPGQLVIVGYRLLNTDELDGAIEALTLAVKKQPNNANARRYLAYAFARAGNPADAESQFKALAALQMLSDEDLFTYCDALEADGNAKQAVDLIAQRLAANEDNVQIRARLARIYYRAGQEQAGDQVVLDGLSRSENELQKQQLLRLIKKSGAQAQPAQQQQQPSSGYSSGRGTHG
jgi:tetratricopeptide (TPR) repeat protein